MFKFPRSGPFYFISGAEGRCDKGQKLVVMVMLQGTRGNTGAPSTSPVFVPFSTVQSKEGAAMALGETPTVAFTSGASFLCSGLLLAIVALAASLVL